MRPLLVGGALTQSSAVKEGELRSALKGMSMNWLLVLRPMALLAGSPARAPSCWKAT